MFLLIVVLLALAVTPTAAQQPKVELCHITGTTYDWGCLSWDPIQYMFDACPEPYGHVIEVTLPAVDAHLAHGDFEQYEFAFKDGELVCKVVRVDPL